MVEFTLNPGFILSLYHLIYGGLLLVPAHSVIHLNGLRGVSMVSHSASLYEIWKKDSFISTQWLTKRALSPGQISQVTLKTNKTVLLHTEEAKTSQRLVTAPEDLGAVGEMASVALHSSHFAIWSTRKWQAFLFSSNKINPNPSSYYFCLIISTILITSLEIIKLIYGLDFTAIWLCQNQAANTADIVTEMNSLTAACPCSSMITK